MEPNHPSLAGSTWTTFCDEVLGPLNHQQLTFPSLISLLPFAVALYLLVLGHLSRQKEARYLRKKVVRSRFLKVLNSHDVKAPLKRAALQREADRLCDLRES